MRRGFAQPIVILGTVIAAVLVISYFYLNTYKNNPLNSPKADSQKEEVKTYTNQSLGFELKYSKDLTVIEDSEEEFNKRGNGDFRKNFKGYITYEPGKFLGAVVVFDKDQKYDANPLTLWVFDNPENLSIDEWYKDYWYYPFVWGDFTYKGKVELAPKLDATISGKLGKSGVIDYQPGKPKFVYLSNDKKMYLFRIIGNAGEEVLSSFKLLKLETINTGGCKVGGCSGQLCVGENDEEISTCEFLAEYACYKTAKCEKQADGQCGWTKTEQLTKCLEGKR